MEPTDASTTTPVPPPARNNPAAETGRRDYFKKPLARYGFELVVIVLGISLSFAVENWRQDREDAKTQRKVLIALADDLENLASEMQDDSAFFASTVSYLLKMEKGVTLTQQEIEVGMTLVWQNQYSMLNAELPSYQSAVSSKAWIEMPDTLRFKLTSLVRVRLPFVANRYTVHSQDFRDKLDQTDLASCLEHPAFLSSTSSTEVDANCLRQKLQQPKTQVLLRLLRVRLEALFLALTAERAKCLGQLAELRHYLNVPKTMRNAGTYELVKPEMRDKP